VHKGAGPRPNRFELGIRLTNVCNDDRASFLAARRLNSRLQMTELQDNISELEDTAAPGEADHVDHVLGQWAEVRPDFDTSPVAVVARLGRAAAYVSAGIDTRLEEFGLSRAGWDVLASLRRTGPPHRLSPTQLYVALMRSSGAMTHRLHRLERQGLIKRVPDAGDARGILVELTRKGILLVDRIAPLHLDNERALLEPLSHEEQQTLAKLLRKLLLAYEHQQPTPPRAGTGGRRRRGSRPS
jgi:DNA-binding MarR family transcriptional regulator